MAALPELAGMMEGSIVNPEMMKGIQGQAGGIDPLALAAMLGSFGAAIAPEGSWQSKLGSVAASMAANAQARKYLSQREETKELKKQEDRAWMARLFGLKQEDKSTQSASKDTTSKKPLSDVAPSSEEVFSKDDMLQALSADPKTVDMLMGGRSALETNKGSIESGLAPTQKAMATNSPMRSKLAEVPFVAQASTDITSNEAIMSVLGDMLGGAFGAVKQDIAGGFGGIGDLIGAMGDRYGR